MLIMHVSLYFIWCLCTMKGIIHLNILVIYVALHVLHSLYFHNHLKSLFTLNINKCKQTKKHWVLSVNHVNIKKNPWLFIYKHFAQSLQLFRPLLGNHLSITLNSCLICCSLDFVVLWNIYVDFYAIHS